MGGFFTTYNVGGFQPVAGQPTMVRMQGVPTMPGYRDRPGKWNAFIPPLAFGLLELVRNLLERLS